MALNSLENILEQGEKLAKQTNSVNQYGMQLEECYGLEKIELLQSHNNEEIYQATVKIIDRYFCPDEDEPSVAPSVQQNEQGLQQFDFGYERDPMNTFEF